MIVNSICNNSYIFYFFGIVFWKRNTKFTTSVTKIIQKDDRYILEKEYRAKISKENRKKSKCEWIRKKRHNDKQLDEYVKLQHNQASKELSYSSEMSDLAFAKWNRQMFRYDKHSSDLVLRKGFKYACDVPKRVSNIINPVQRRVIC